MSQPPERAVAPSGAVPSPAVSGPLALSAKGPDTPGAVRSPGRRGSQQRPSDVFRTHIAGRNEEVFTAASASPQQTPIEANGGGRRVTFADPAAAMAGAAQPPRATASWPETPVRPPVKPNSQAPPRGDVEPDPCFVRGPHFQLSAATEASCSPSKPLSERGAGVPPAASSQGASATQEGKLEQAAAIMASLAAAPTQGDAPSPDATAAAAAAAASSDATRVSQFITLASATLGIEERKVARAIAKAAAKAAKHGGATSGQVSLDAVLRAALARLMARGSA